MILEGADDVRDFFLNFELGAMDLYGIELLVGVYAPEGYEGSGYALFKKDGQLYEVHSSHCSCNGMDWRPEPVTLKDLQARVKLVEGSGRRDFYFDALSKWLRGRRKP